MTPGPTLPLALYLGLTRAGALPLRAWAARRHRAQGADPARLAERFAREPGLRPPGRLIWVHAASVGEVTAVAALAEALGPATGATILLTTLTAAGADRARARMAPGLLHRFLPLDTPGPVGRFLDRWRPDLAVFVESDLWPRLVLAAAARGVPLALVNARASRSRARAPRTLAALLSRFALITTQDEGIARDLSALGLDPARILAAGDLKAAAAPLPVDRAALTALAEVLGRRPVWAAVSTHAEDEGPVLSAHAAAIADRPGLVLLMVPRHPDRAEAIGRACRIAGLSAARRSRAEMPGPGTSVYILDTLGETGLVFRAAPLTFLGGSFGPQGGHNPYEPAALGAAILSGPRVAHFAGAYAGLAAAGAAETCADGAALGRAVARLLGSPRLPAMQGAGRAYVARAAGACDRTLPRLAALLPQVAP